MQLTAKHAARGFSTQGINLDKDDNKIIVTTIQKLNNLIKGEGDLPVYNKQVVFTQGILWENRRASKTKLIIFLEFLFKILLCFTKLATVCLIKNKDYLLNKRILKRNSRNIISLVLLARLFSHKMPWVLKPRAACLAVSCIPM
jgi:hypothetical protein